MIFQPDSQLHEPCPSKRGDCPSCTMKERVDETKSKIKLVREHLNSSGLEAALLRRKDNFSWMTAGASSGVVLNTEIGAAALLITEKNQYLIASVSEIPRFIEEEYIEDLGFTPYSIPWQKTVEDTVDLLVPGMKIGSDIESKEMKQLSIRQLRYSLVRTEVKRFLNLGHRATQILEKTMLELSPADTELEVVGKLAKVLWEAGIEPINMLCAGSKRVERFRHPLPTPELLDKSCMISLGAREGGLIVSLTRMVIFGSCPVKIQRYQEAVNTIAAGMIRRTQPGTSVADIIHAAKDEYSHLGWADEFHRHHQGGAIGYLPREYRVSSESNEIVTHNQGFCWNPTIVQAKNEETILTSSKGIIHVTKPQLFGSRSIGTGTDKLRFPDIQEL